jgi:hypothetical protein
MVQLLVYLPWYVEGFGFEAFFSQGFYFSLQHLFLFKFLQTIYFSYFKSQFIVQVWALQVTLIFPAILFIPQGFWRLGFKKVTRDLQACFYLWFL